MRAGSPPVVELADKLNKESTETVRIYLDREHTSLPEDLFEFMKDKFNLDDRYSEIGEDIRSSFLKEIVNYGRIKINSIENGEIIKAYYLEIFSHRKLYDKINLFMDIVNRRTHLVLELKFKLIDEIKNLLNSNINECQLFIDYLSKLNEKIEEKKRPTEKTIEYKFPFTRSYDIWNKLPLEVRKSIFINNDTLPDIICES